MKIIHQKPRKSRNNFSRLLCVAALSTCSMFANAQQQQINLSGTNLSLRKAFQQIEKQTNLSVDYKSNDLNDAQILQSLPQKGSLNQIMDILLDGTNCKVSYSGNHIIIKKVQDNKQLNISGTVLDQDGLPVIGANVLVQGTTNGTVTDLDGKFALTVSQGDILTVSYIGYNTKTIKITSEKNLSISLQEDTKTLDELVVVAFGTQKKSSLTSSIAMVGSDKFSNRPVTNTGQALQGLLPGLNLTMNAQAGGNVNSTLNINIRGTGTIGKDSNDSPLVLIDGVEGDMNMINPQDIDNISVLKDASASSIYGSRAAFGVILITTKKGSEGKCKITYSNNLQINTPQILPDQMDSYTYVNYMNQAFKNDGKSPFFSDLQVERVKQYQEGTLIKEGASSFDPSWTIDPMSNGQYRVRDYWANTDWLDLLTKDKVFNHEHNISLSGGTEKVRYYVSGNYMKKSGLAQFIDDSFNRYTFMARMNVECNKWLKMQTINRFTRSDFETASAASGTYTMWSYIPIAPLYDPYGHYIQYENLIPLIEGGRYKKQQDISTNSLQFIITPFKDFKITADGTYRINTNFNHNDVQKVVAYDGNNKPFYIRNAGHAPGVSEVKEFVDKSNFFSTSITADYHKTFATDHDLDLLAGFQYEKYDNRDVQAIQDGIITPELPTLNTTNGLNDRVQGGYRHWATAGYFGRINYAYKSKYLTEIKLRYDGSSRFLHDKRWNLFPSFSLGWNIAKEKFMSRTSNYLNTLKLRASLGTLGNQNTTSLYPFYSFLPLGSGNGNWLVGGEKTNTAGNPGLVSALLGWEKIRDYNIGLDFGWLNNRLTGSIDYYHRYTDDMVGPGVEKPNTLGTAVPVVNNADLVTKGFELELSWRDKLANGFGYGVRFVLSDSQTKVRKYPNEQMKTSTFYNGKMLGEIWGYDVIGIAKTQEEMDNHLAHVKQNFNGGTKWQAGDLMYVDANGDGEINEGKGVLNDMGDKRVIGNSTPRYNFGLTLNADYKGWSFSAFFNGTMKRDFWTDNRALWGAVGSVWSSAPFSQCLDYFRPEDTTDPLGPNVRSYLPGLTFSGKNRQVNSAYLQNAAYIKLKNIQIGYTFPKSLISKIGLENLHLYTSFENLWTGTKLFDTIDPEMLNASGNFYPLSTTYSFGLNVTF